MAEGFGGEGCVRWSGSEEKESGGGHFGLDGEKVSNKLVRIFWDEITFRESPLIYIY